MISTATPRTIPELMELGSKVDAGELLKFSDVAAMLERMTQQEVFLPYQIAYQTALLELIQLAYGTRKEGM